MVTVFTTPTHCQPVTEDLISRLASKARQKFKVPAVVVTYMNEDSILLNHWSGVRNSTSNQPIQDGDFFHIGSCTKSILATLAGRMIEAGQLRWNTRFFDLFPEWEIESLPVYNDITLEKLFLCRAGIRPYTRGHEVFPMIDPGENNIRMAFARWLLKQTPAAKKKADGSFPFLYSNAGYTLISLMLEKVSGQSWLDMLRHLLKSGGMEIILGWPNTKHPDQPWGHGNFYFNPETGEEKIFREARPFSPQDPYRISSLIAPAGDISMRPLDFAKYVQCHLRGLRGSTSLLTPATFEYIHFSGKGYSLGTGNGRLGGKTFTGFDGSTGTFYCRGLIIPEENVALTIMTNSGSKKAVDWITRKIIKTQFSWWWKVWL